MPLHVKMWDSKARKPRS